ncbi:hypothetical protein LCL97_14425 [Seohaeicola saemankumensis]|nr:hypothetical protein [Seohaeicola saemankumensis]MCA0872032.1 hypothetical protein [Seohaeicola saemankumensis]
MFGLIPIAGLVAFCVYLFRHNSGGGSYEGLGDLLFFGGGAFTISAAAGFNILASWLTAPQSGRPFWRGVQILIILAPALFVSGRALWFQWLPNAPCATSQVELTMGGKQLTVPKALGAVIELAVDDDARTERLRYTSDPNRKPDVRRLCQLTGPDQTPVRANRLRISPINIVRNSDQVCETQGEAPVWCTDHATAPYEDFREIILLTDFDRRWNYLKRLFPPEFNPDHTAAGSKTQGHLCRYTPAKGTTHCQIWRPLPGIGTVYLETAYHAEKPADVLPGQVDSAIAITLRALAYE